MKIETINVCCVIYIRYMWFVITCSTCIIHAFVLRLIMFICNETCLYVCLTIGNKGEYLLNEYFLLLNINQRKRGILFYYSLLYLVLKICPYPHVDMNIPTIVTCNETFVFQHEKIIFHRSDMVVCLRRTILIIFSYYFYLVCK